MNYKVVVSTFPDNVASKHVKAIRLIGKMSLRDSYAIALYCRGRRDVTLVSGIHEKPASVICKSLVEYGISARIEKCEDDFPMRLSPAVTGIFRWSFGFIVKLRA